MSKRYLNHYDEITSYSNMDLLKEISEISGCSVNPIYEEFKIFRKRV